MDDLLKGCWTGHAGGKNFSFVTGGVTVGSQVASILGTSIDENVQVTQPNTTISTAVEDLTTLLILDLLHIPRTTFEGRTITSGATSSNILGLACARDYLSTLFIPEYEGEEYSISEHGFFPLLQPMQVLTVKPHGSIYKAASVVGIGRRNVIDISMPSEEKGRSLGFDLDELEKRLKRGKEEGRGILVVVQLGEVNTGGMTPNIPLIAELCDAYDSWLHIDAAFGGFGALLEGMEYLSDEMALADSLTLDAHKWLQAPYDTAFFYTRHQSSLTRSFGPSPTLGAPAYLSSAPSASFNPSGLSKVDEGRWKELRGWQCGVESPLNLGLENSRRFRGLPVFAGLLEMGREGFVDIITRNCNFASNLADWLLDTTPSGGGSYYQLLNHTPTSPRSVPLNIILFRARPTTRLSDSSAPSLVAAINANRQIYVSGTTWDGAPAVRMAVSNWRTGVKEGRDEILEVVKGVLMGAVVAN